MHGIVREQDGSAALVFPFLRAIWELWQHNKEAIRQRKLKFRDARYVGYFQDRWFRLLQVLNKIISLENIILGDQRTSQEWSIAYQEFPFWLDLFFFYAPMLADALTVSLGQLLSDAPDSFPREAKRLFGNSSWIAKCKLRCDERDLLTAISQNRDWFLRLRPDEGKGIRDSIVHRLCKWQVTTIHGRSEIDWQEKIRVELEGVAADISPDEALDTISSVMTGLCSFLSALPLETWLRHEFEARDFITSATGNGIGGRFLPTLPINLDEETSYGT